MYWQKRTRPTTAGRRAVKNSAGGRIAIALGASLFVALAGCTPTNSGGAGGGAEADGELTIACIVKDASASVWKAAIAGCEEAGEKYGATIISGGGTNDTDLAGQLSAFNNAITKGADGIAFAAVDSAGMLTAVNDATADGIKVSTFDAGVEGADDLTTSVVADDKQGAFDGATYMAEQLGGKGEVAITTCSQSITTCKAVFEGFSEAIANYPEMSVVGSPLATPDRDKAFQAIRNILGANPNLAGVYSTYDLDGLGALEAANSVGKKLVIVSRGCSKEGLESIAAGGLAGCNALFIKREAYAAVEAIVKDIEGEEVDKLTLIPSDVVGPDQVDAWLAIPEFTGPPAE